MLYLTLKTRVVFVEPGLLYSRKELLTRRSETASVATCFGDQIAISVCRISRRSSLLRFSMFTKKNRDRK